MLHSSFLSTHFTGAILNQQAVKARHSKLSPHLQWYKHYWCNLVIIKVITNNDRHGRWCSLLLLVVGTTVFVREGKTESS